MEPPPIFALRQYTDHWLLASPIAQGCLPVIEIAVAGPIQFKTWLAPDGFIAQSSARCDTGTTVIGKAATTNLTVLGTLDCTPHARA